MHLYRAALPGQGLQSPEMRAKEYHHGNLAQALLDAADALLEDRGAAEISLRQVATSVGVAPSAAYHHFADRNALLDALAARALDRLAAAVQRRVARVPVADVPGRVVALGRGYVSWAREEPHRFAVAFAQGDRPDTPANLRPYVILTELLDEAVTRGVMPARSRPNAEHLVWPALHGLAVLGSSGPLQDRSERELLALCDELVLTLLAGLRARGS